MTPLRVLLKRPDEPARTEFLPRGLEGAQAAVGGLIDVVSLAPGIDLVINEEGTLLGMEPNFVLVLEDCVIPIVGPAFVVGVDEEGDFQSLTEEQVETLSKRWLGLECLLAPGCFPACLPEVARV